MSGFSGDGKWWWDGSTWVATSRVVLPDLPQTEFELSGKLRESGARAKTFSRLDWWRTFAQWNSTVAHGWAFGIPSLVILPRLVRDLRTWRLEQLALATAYLLGPDEPILAGETATLAVFHEDYPTGGTAVAVTAAHVLVFRIDSSGQGQPRWIALARRPTDVKIEFRKRLMGLAPGLIVTDGDLQWTIRGLPGLIKPQPVLDAWRQAAEETASSGV